MKPQKGRGSPFVNADQFAWPLVYAVVGLTSGHLVHTANFRKWQRDEVIRRAYEEEQRRKSAPP